MIDIYSDETKCKFKSFQIDSALFGTTENCSSLKKEINKILTKRGVRILKGSKIKEGNWHFYEKCLDDIFQLLMKRISEEKLGILIIINSHLNYSSQIGFIKRALQTQLENKSSTISKLLHNLDHKLYPLIYHSVDQLFIYLAFRKKIDPEETVFNFYPDLAGNIIKHRDKIVSLSATRKSFILPFHEIVKIVANLLQETITDFAINYDHPDWPKDKTQKLKRFYPKKDNEEIMIQIADVLSNFLLSFLRYKCGIDNKSNTLKAHFFDKYVNYQSSGLNTLIENFKTKQVANTNSSEIYLDSGFFTHTIQLHKQNGPTYLF